MGGTNSKSTSQAFTDIATNITQETIQTCTSLIRQNQNVDQTATGDIIGIDIKQGMVASVDLDCAFSASKQSEIFAKVANAIAQAAESQTEGALTSLGGTTAEVSASIFTSFRNNITQTDIQSLKTSIEQSQNVNQTAGGNIIGINIDQQQAASSIAKIIVESTNMSKIIQEIANKVDQEAASKSTGLVASVAKTLGLTLAAAALVVPLTIAAVVILIIVIIMIPVIMIIRKNKKTTGGDDEDEETKSNDVGAETKSNDTAETKSNDTAETKSNDTAETKSNDTEETDSTDVATEVMEVSKRDHDCGCSEGVCRCEADCKCTGDCPCVKKDK